jgi:hypothetical protein
MVRESPHPGPRTSVGHNGDDWYEPDYFFTVPVAHFVREQFTGKKPKREKRKRIGFVLPKRRRK